ncbi:MAG TPA: TSUP family transporter, partial [Actinomycetes bacterium]|nr:TSUP family transporter [Actinomycetes bacterium]
MADPITLLFVGAAIGLIAGLLVVGAVLMLRAASAARRSGTSRRPDPPAMAGGAVAPDRFRSDALDEAPRPTVVALASSVGLLTGLFGVGAGFVVVPALVSAIRLPVKRATATALVVIVRNSGVAL